MIQYLTLPMGSRQRKLCRVIQPTTRTAAKGSHKCAAGVKGGGHCRTLASGDRHTLRRYRTVRGRNTGMQVAPGRVRRTNDLKYCTEAICNHTVDPLYIHKHIYIYKQIMAHQEYRQIPFQLNVMLCACSASFLPVWDKNERRGEH